MKKIRVKKITNLSSLTSHLWFVNDEHIEEFMNERCFKKECNSETTGLSFTPNGIDVFICINTKTHDYELVLGFSEKEIILDVGKVLAHNTGSLHLSGIYLQDCEVVLAKT